MPNLTRLLNNTVAVEAARLRIRLFNAAASLLLLGVACLTALIGLVFLLVGMYQSLAEGLPAWQAGGLTALAVLIIAGVLLLVSRRWIIGRPPPPAGATISSVARDLRQTAERGINAGEVLAGKGVKPFDLALVAFIAGLVLSKSVSTRREPPPRQRDHSG